eukprot:GHVH01000213.1.p1 GENE.GHVH01000213.1~~GHVH01000213.1.p1  ORF type:complete len:820 (+),score=108.51 GHVH01000213.1:67-2526(+)
MVTVSESDNEPLQCSSESTLTISGEIKERAMEAALLAPSPCGYIIKKAFGSHLDKIEEYSISNNFQKQADNIICKLLSAMGDLAEATRGEADTSRLKVQGDEPLSDAMVVSKFRDSYGQFHTSARYLVNCLIKAEDFECKEQLEDQLEFTRKRLRSSGGRDEVDDSKRQHNECIKETTTNEHQTVDIPRPVRDDWDTQNVVNAEIVFLPMVSDDVLNRTYNHLLKEALRIRRDQGEARLSEWMVEKKLILSDREQEEVIKSHDRQFSPSFPFPHPYKAEVGEVDTWLDDCHDEVVSMSPEDQQLLPTDESEDRRACFLGILMKELCVYVPVEPNSHGARKKNDFPGRYPTNWLTHLSKGIMKADILDALPDSIPLFVVDNGVKLVEAIHEIRKSKHRIITVDVEHFQNDPTRWAEASIRESSYQGFTALIQVSTVELDIIIDPIPFYKETSRTGVNALNGLNEVFADPTYLKVLHDCRRDSHWLERDCGLYLINVFDTFQAAGVLASSSKSLKGLATQYLNLPMNKKEQLSNWSTRPLTPKQLNYARLDTRLLLYIFYHMKNALLLGPNRQTATVLQGVKKFLPGGSMCPTAPVLTPLGRLKVLQVLQCSHRASTCASNSHTSTRIHWPWRMKSLGFWYYFNCAKSIRAYQWSGWPPHLKRYAYVADSSLPSPGVLLLMWQDEVAKKYDVDKAIIASMTTMGNIIESCHYTEDHRDRACCSNKDIRERERLIRERHKDMLASGMLAPHKGLTGTTQREGGPWGYVMAAALFDEDDGLPKHHHDRTRLRAISLWFDKYAPRVPSEERLDTYVQCISDERI